MAAIAGSILGLIIKPYSVQSNTLGLTILVGIIFYIGILFNRRQVVCWFFDVHDSFISW